MRVTKSRGSDGANSGAPSTYSTTRYGCANRSPLASKYSGRRHCAIPVRATIAADRIRQRPRADCPATHNRTNCAGPDASSRRSWCGFRTRSCRSTSRPSAATFAAASRPGRWPGPDSGNRTTPRDRALVLRASVATFSRTPADRMLCTPRSVPAPAQAAPGTSPRRSHRVPFGLCAAEPS